MPNTIPRLLDRLRLTLHDPAQWTGVSRAAVAAWQQGSWGPTPERRAALVQAVRRHANELLKLAERVEREAADPTAPAHGRSGRDTDGRRGVPKAVRPTRPRRAKKRARMVRR